MVAQQLINLDVLKVPKSEGRKEQLRKAVVVSANYIVSDNLFSYKMKLTKSRLRQHPLTSKPKCISAPLRLPPQLDLNMPTI